MKIDSFSGKYRFLSNFYPAQVRWEGEVYPSVEHAYQAAKFPQGSERVPFRNPHLRAAEAKRLGSGKGGEEWHWKSLPTMLELLRQKFQNDWQLRAGLVGTGDAELIEGNWWGDTFFGVCKGVGENHLGKLLMQVRGELQ